MVCDATVVSLPLQLRRLVVVLALANGRSVSTERIIDALWRDHPPDNAAGTVFAHVSKLRRHLGRDRGVVASARPGYRLALQPGDLDAFRFESGLAEGRRRARAGDLAGAADALVEALAEWRGDALAEFHDEDFARVEAIRLTQLRDAATRALAAAWADTGRAEEAQELLDQLAAAGPFGAAFTILRGAR